MPEFLTDPDHPKPKENARFSEAGALVEIGGMIEVQGSIPPRGKVSFSEAGDRLRSKEPDRRKNIGKSIAFGAWRIA